MRIVRFINALLFLLLVISGKQYALTTFTVGNTLAGADYATIAAAYADCSAADSYVIEIRSDYTQELLPIILGNLANKSATNNVIIRPQLGVTNLSFANTILDESFVFQFSSANYVTLDGRADGAGGSQTTISNNQTAQGQAIRLDGDCSFITIKYCTLKGSNTTTSVGSLTTNAGVFQIGESGSGNLTDITIDNCTLTQGTGGLPTHLITSFSNSGTVTGTISNCSLIDAKLRYIRLSTGSTGWTISNNHFYQSDNIAPSTSATHCFIRINGGSNYTISNNFMGGRAINCGGAAYSTSSYSHQFHAISFDNGVTGTITLENNVINNLTITNNYGSSPAFTFCYIGSSSGTYNIGSSGNANTFGSTSGTGGVLFTDDGSSVSASFALIYSQGSGSVNVTYNNFGSITLAGGNTGGRATGLYTENTTASIFSNNIIGNETANNISDGVARTVSATFGLRHTSSGVATSSSNTFQNINFSSASSGDVYGNYSTTASSYTGSSNTFSNISSARTGDIRLTYISIAGAVTSNSNSIGNITLTDAGSKFYGLDLRSSANDITCSLNTIGNSNSNNITLAGNTINYGIYISIPTTKTATLASNIIQNFNLTNTGTSAGLYSIEVAGVGSVDLNNSFIQYHQLATTKAASTFSFIGIALLNTGASNSLVRNRIRDISMLTTSNVDVIMAGIYSSGAVASSSMKTNKITGLTNTATGSPKIHGIYIHSTASSWDFHNNVVLLDNGANTNACDINGLISYSTGTFNVLHNTFKTSGSVASGSSDSRAYYDASASGTRVIKNNLLYNLRTGGTGAHRSYRNTASGSVTIDYNYHESTNNQVWNNSSVSFATYQTNSGASNDIKNNGTATISVEGAVTSGSAGTVASNGENLIATVATDFDGNSRVNPPWRGAFETATPLPVNIVSISAQIIGEKVEISWTTFSEVNNDFFTIERTSDGNNYETVGTILGAGNTTQILNYSFADLEPIIGNSYYRLSQTDYDGKSEQFELIPISFLKNAYKFETYPNPIQNDAELNIRLSDCKGEAVEIQIHNYFGVQLFSEAFTSCSDEIKIPIRHTFKPGMYIITASNKSYTERRQFIVKQ